MKMQPVSSDLLGKVVQAMASHVLFKGTEPGTLSEVASECLLVHYTADEPMLVQGEKPDRFLLLLRGQVVNRITPPGMSATYEVDRVGPVQAIGETDLLLEQPRRMSTNAADQVLVLQVPQIVFKMLFKRAPPFALALSQALAQRLQDEGHRVPLPWFDIARQPPPTEIVRLLPQGFIERHRVIPLRSQGNQLFVGFVDDLTAHLIHAAQTFVPGIELVPVRIDAAGYNQVLQSLPQIDLPPEREVESSGSVSRSSVPVAGGAPRATLQRPIGNEQRSAPKLDPLLKRMIAEGASDLHLSAGHRPRWRIDGEMREIAEAKVLGDMQVWELLEAAMPDRNREQFISDNDTDFAYALPDVARFRVNVFRDQLGVGSVLRQIPSKILSLEQLGLPTGVQRMCDNPKGLVLVTGPTGSGKSTTLAAMLDYINRNRRTHIITLEDPIEFVHKSQRSLVNQREVGPHTKSFSRALRASLREDPDIIMVGEMRDLETIQLALETANTGHLVFGTLHTSTAISTIDRIIDVFPPDQQSQVRAVLSDVLKGVVAQTLLRRKGGGRIAALEVLIGSHAVANLIREGKNHQIFNIMLTSKKQGNMLLNEQLQILVTDGKVEYDEAIMKAIDKGDFAKRFGREYFEAS